MNILVQISKAALIFLLSAFVNSSNAVNKATYCQKKVAPHENQYIFFCQMLPSHRRTQVVQTSYLGKCYVCKWLGHDMNMGYMSSL